MNENGEIGFNAGGARSNLNAFTQGMNSAIAKYNSTCEEFMNELSNTWASPKAVEFGNAYEGELINISTSLRTMGQTIITNAVSAINAMARANGSSFYYDGNISSSNCNITKLLPQKDGKVGMDINSVEASLGKFQGGIQTFLSMLDNLPTGISLYDPSGEQRSAYIGLIGNKKSQIAQMISDIAKGLNTCIEEEKTKVIAAKQQSVSDLSA